MGLLQCMGGIEDAWNVVAPSMQHLFGQYTAVVRNLGIWSSTVYLLENPWLVMNFYWSLTIVVTTVTIVIIIQFHCDASINDIHNDGWRLTTSIMTTSMPAE